MATTACAIESENGVHIGFVPKPFDHMFWDAGDRRIVRDDALARGFRTVEEDGYFVRALAVVGLESFIQIIENPDHSNCGCGMGNFALFANFDFMGDFQTLEDAKVGFNRIVGGVKREVDILPV